MLGVIGGMGPKATATFYLMLMNLVASRANGSLPRIAMQNVAMSPRIENAFLVGGVERQSLQRTEIRRLLSEAVALLGRTGVEIIAMPCNTLQEELASICAEHGIARIDMIDETVKAIVARGLRRVLVLGTSSTCQADVYGRRLRKDGTACIYPEGSVQQEIERIIRDELDLRSSKSSAALARIVREGFPQCDGIVIACTDLTGCISEAECRKPVFDSLACLVQSAADWILERRHRFLIDAPKDDARQPPEFHGWSLAR